MRISEMSDLYFRPRYAHFSYTIWSYILSIGKGLWDTLYTSVHQCNWLLKDPYQDYQDHQFQQYILNLIIKCSNIYVDINESKSPPHRLPPPSPSHNLPAESRSQKWPNMCMQAPVLTCKIQIQSKSFMCGPVKYIFFLLSLCMQLISMHLLLLSLKCFFVEHL